MLYFDFNGMDYTQPDSLYKVLDDRLSSYEDIYGRTTDEKGAAIRFKHLIKNAHDKTGLGVVVLVDEYDKSLLESDEKLQAANRALFKGFFGNLKSSDEYLKFTFITGVTRFSKVSIFSDLNNLRDISLSEDFASICGIKKNEMIANFEPEIENLAAKNGFSKDECVEKLEKMYDGYHFFPGSEGVYNPFSLINAFKNQNFESSVNEWKNDFNILSFVAEEKKVKAEQAIAHFPSLLENLPCPPKNKEDAKRIADILNLLL